MFKIGLIQTRGLGDIIISAPIAMYYIDRGCEVYWPIDSEFIFSFQCAFPKIKFIAINKERTGSSTADYFYNEPLNELNRNSCDVIFCLYSYLTGFNLQQPRLQTSLSFDVYKYAVAKVPFKEKWNFNPVRNKQREQKLFQILNINSDTKYNLIHDVGSDFSLNIESFIENKELKSIKISALTDNIFDWIGVIEKAAKVYFIDSVYSNLTEQLNISVNKKLFLRSPSPMTPVFINNWEIE